MFAILLACHSIILMSSSELKTENYLRAGEFYKKKKEDSGTLLSFDSEKSKLINTSVKSGFS